MRDRKGTPFVFVTTDLWAITEGQKMAVVKQLSGDPLTEFIGESELLLAATHSHHGSGVNEMDKAFSSTSIGFGIDTAVFNFTIRQVVSGIKDAVRSAEVSTVSYTMEEVVGIARNRSRKAYFQNTAGERRLYLPPGLAGPEENEFYRTDEEENSTIEKWLTVITVKDSNEKIKGILASYSMHPTATGDATEVYSADVFGIAAAKASDSIAGNPVVAFYNGAEGDVAPDYRFHQRSDAVRIADSLVKAIKQAIQSEDQISLHEDTIGHRTAIIDISSNEAALTVDDENCYDEKAPFIVKTAATPEVGASFVAGASDGRTSLSSFGVGDGIKSPTRRADQGHKMPAIDFMSDNAWKHILPKWARIAAKKWVKLMKARSELHISVHNVGDVFFTGLPGEFTTMLGRRIRKTIADTLDIPYEQVSLVGLADAYVSYVTTPCEFEAQYYEGASNVYGISTGLVFEKEYERLAARLNPDIEGQRKKRKVTIDAGTVVNFGPQFLGDLQVWNANEGLHNLMVSADGFKVYSKEIPPIGKSRGVMDVDSNEIIVFSFEGRVNKINFPPFYPGIVIRKRSGEVTAVVPEHTLTIDRYAKTGNSTWTVRILNTSSFADGVDRQIIITTLSGTTVLSGFFRVIGSGTK